MGTVIALLVTFLTGAICGAFVIALVVAKDDDYDE